MNDHHSDDDGERGIDRRAVLGSLAAGAAGIGGLTGIGGASTTGPEIEEPIRTHGTLTPAEAIEKLRQLDDFDGAGDADAGCYTETKCAGGCGYQGAVAHRTCCPNLGDCGACCGSWEYTNLCC